MTTAEKWQRRLDRQAKSNLTVAEFCRRENLGPASFYAWRRKLASFTLIEASNDSSLTIQVGSAKIDITENFDADLLRRVIGALS